MNFAKIIAGALGKPYLCVKSFHLAFDHPCPDVPTAQPQDRAEKRAKWVKDECDELVDAQGVLVDQADAYLDIIYFGFGGLVELGIDPSPLWDIVQAANMAKLQPDGSVARHPDGKTKKPDGWQKPEPWLGAEVARQIRIADRTSGDRDDSQPIVYGQDLSSLQPSVDRAD